MTTPNEDLAKKVNNAGFNYEFYKGINNLETLKQYVDSGKVSPEVYKQLEETFFRVHAKSEQKSASGNGIGNKMKSAFGQILKRPGKKSPTDKIREQGSPARTTSRSRGISLRSRTDSVKSGYSNKSQRTLRGVSRSGTPPSQKATKPIVSGELLKFVRKKKRKEWKHIFVTLYEDRLEFTAKKGDPKVLKTVYLNKDFYISELNKGHFKRAHNSPSAENLNDSSGSEDDEPGIRHAPEVLDVPHVFVISNINQSTKIFLAAESEEKKSLWVTMTIEVLRDLQETGRNGPKIWDEMENRANKYVARKLRNSIMRPQGLEGVNTDQMSHRIGRIQEQAQLTAEKSVVHEWRSKEKAKMNQIKKENEVLQTLLEDKSKELVEFKELKEKEVAEIKKEKAEELQKYKAKEKELLKYKELNEEWKSKYDELMEKYRQEAHERNQERRREEEKIKNEIKALRRRSVMPTSDAGRDYEREIEMYKKKLETLQKALKVDFDELDWDGTLEQAEEKMGDCLKLIIEGETPQIQMKAQQDFDKWDQLIRNHEDYINREKNKWAEWEEENYHKNQDALHEMKTRFVPEIFLNGCSEKELIDATGVKKKTALRIMKNKIFKFFWMDKDFIAKIHAADLLNSYASQGLDIRELRAVYATLPDEFQNDNDGKKKAFRDNLRNRLSELTKKEKAGTLASAEEMNNSYRDKAVSDDKPKFEKVKRSNQGVNRKLAGQAAALEAFFLKQGGGSAPPKAKKPSPGGGNSAGGGGSSGASSSKKSDLDANDEQWQKFFKMQKMNLPDGAIEQKMMKEGHDPKLWEKLKQLKASGGSSAPKKTSAVDPDAPEWAKYFRMKKAGLADGAIMNKMMQEGLDPGAWEKVKAAKEKEAPEEKKELNPDDPIWEEYFKMKKLGLGAGQIQNRMMKDGRDPLVWPQLVEMQEKLSAKTQPTNIVSPFDFASDAPKPKEPSEDGGKDSDSSTSHKKGKKIIQLLGEEAVEETPEEKAMSTPEEDLKRAMKKLNKRKSKTGKIQLDENGEPKKKAKHKKKSSKIGTMGADGVLLPQKPNRRKTKKASKTETHLLQATPSALLRKLQVDADIDDLANMKRGSHAIKLMDYNENVNRGKRQSVLAGTVRKKRTLRKSKVGDTLNVGVRIEDTLEEVKTVIVTDGFVDAAEGGIKTMKFGDLAMKFNTISDMLVGVLMKGKRTGDLKYEGNMLFLGIHDEVKITVLKYD